MAVPTFALSVERKGRVATLSVPATLAAPLRMKRLTELLAKEKWAVTGSTAHLVAGAAGAPPAAVHAAELLFVRDVLGPLRLRPGAVPEKHVAKLLEVGVIALHRRSQDLFGQSWADFVLGAAAAPPPAAAVPAKAEPPLAAPAAPEAPLTLPAVSAVETEVEAEAADSYLALLLGCSLGCSPACHAPAAFQSVDFVPGLVEEDGFDSVPATPAASAAAAGVTAVPSAPLAPPPAPAPAPAPPSALPLLLSFDSPAPACSPADFVTASFEEAMAAFTADAAGLLVPDDAPPSLLAPSEGLTATLARELDTYLPGSQPSFMDDFPPSLSPL